MCRGRDWNEMDTALKINQHRNLLMLLLELNRYALNNARARELCWLLQRKRDVTFTFWIATEKYLHASRCPSSQATIVNSVVIHRSQRLIFMKNPRLFRPNKPLERFLFGQVAPIERFSDEGWDFVSGRCYFPGDSAWIRRGTAPCGSKHHSKKPTRH